MRRTFCHLVMKFVFAACWHLFDMRLKTKELLSWNDVIVAWEYCFVLSAYRETWWKHVSTHFILHTVWITTKFSSGSSEVIKKYSKGNFSHNALNPLNKHPLLVGKTLLLIDATVMETEKQPAGAAMIMMQCSISD